MKVSHFNELEAHKENIVPHREGRSAQRLTAALQQSVSDIADIRLSYERRIMDELEELDDPLELYLEYLSWLNDAYPQGATTRQSGIIDVMERCLKYFQELDIYRNDPRYLKVWLWYTEVFVTSLQEKKDVFVHLLRRQVGAKLALFYEEFASILCERKEYGNAVSMLKRGIDCNARPLQRLRKTLSELERKLLDGGFAIEELQRMERLPEPQSELILGRGRAEIEQQRMVTERPGSGSKGKMQVFKDDTEGPQTDDWKLSGWAQLDGKDQRNKENKLHAIPLVAGARTDKQPQYSAEKSDIEKIPIFSDALGRSGPVYKILEQPGRKSEKIECNFDLLYPDKDHEFCIEELLAIARNVYYKKVQPRAPTHSTSILTPNKNKRRKAVLQEKTDTPTKIASPLPHTRQYSPEYKNITTTSILPLKDDNADDNTNYSEGKPRSPTVTMFSRDAMKEVYSMFNQHYTDPKPLSDNDDTTSRFAVFENFTEEFTRKNMDDLTEVKQAPVEESLYTEEQQRSSQSGKETITPSYKSKLQDYMTPIQERSESTFRLIASQEDGLRKRRQSDAPSMNTAESSPFFTQPQEETSIQENIINNPLSKALRQQLLESLQPDLKTYDDYYQYTQPLKMSALLKKIHKVTKNVNKNPIVDFKKTNDLYCIRAELGEGGYATVYLAESSTGQLRALKVEKPASVWEFYILKQVEKRLAQTAILRSIINVSALHCFQDESYLVLNYASQGTVLDLINLEKHRSGSSLDECLCIFITVELMKVIECIHEVGIIHGDIKPDNCMLRFEACTSLGDYNPYGENGWSKKGIFLIDFGRSFDLTLFPIGTKFTANWTTDQQDCPEMREGRPWSYEADYYGLAGIIHAMLFGKYIETGKFKDGYYRLSNSLKRYWRKDIWEPLFNLLLNSGRRGDQQTIISELKKHRSRMEGYLESETSTKLRNIILGLETELTKGR
ncbi:AaceriAGR315Cp [[Ashbya] aceris (nom. inval.)]|nr:AaceriAGR315Cp [[Ashbya] aceris (nom. inval.)]